MPTLSTPDFVSALQKSQFLTGSQLEELKNLRKQFAEPKELAQELVRRGWLTQYQAKYLVQGRGGHLVVGPFRIIDKLREMPLGKVYKARHVHMNRLVTLLLLAKEQRGNTQLLQQLTRAAAQLAHPNIVQAFDVGQAGEISYMATEFVEGSDMGQLVQKHGPVPAVLAGDFIRQAALGLQHAHEKGVIHGDINPGHLLVTSPGPGAPPQIKVNGFGSGRLELAISHSPTGGMVPQANRPEAVDYLSPEQARDPQTNDPRSDIFSLGCTLYFLLAGRPPFQGTSVMDRTLVRMMEDAPPIQNFRPDVPPGLAAVLTRMLARDPAQRFQSVAEVVQALGQPLAPAAPQAPVAAPVVPVAAPNGAWQAAPEWAGAAPVAPSGSNFSFQSETAAPMAAAGTYAAEDVDLVAVTPPRRRQQSKAPLAIAAGIGLVLLGGATVGVAYLLKGPPEEPQTTGVQLVVNTPTPTRATPPPDTRPTVPSTRPVTPMPLPMPMPPMPMPMPPEMMPAEGEKQPVPAEAAITKTLGEVQEIFKADFAKTQPAERLALSAKLQQKALETLDDKVARYVLFREAADLAAKAGDAAAALEILEDLGGEFAIPALDMKTAALEAAAPAAFTPAANQNLINAVLPIIEESVAAEDFPRADKLLQLAEAAAPKAFNLALVNSVKTHRAELETLQKDLEKIKPAKEKLAQNGDDPEANEAVGRFYCFVKNDFEKGFPFLLQGKDEKLKEIAEKELAGSMEAPEQAKLGDAWWELADKEEGPTKTAMLKRAFVWYQQALPGLSGLDLAKVENRVKEITKLVPSVRGRWDHLDISEAKALADYLRVEGIAKRVATKQGYGQAIDIALTARSAKNLQLAAFMGTVTFDWDKKVLSITRPDTGKAMGKVPLRAHSANAWHQIRWQITDKSLRVYLDNKLLFQDKSPSALSGEEPVRVLAQDSVLDVKALSVTPVKKP